MQLITLPKTKLGKLNLRMGALKIFKKKSSWKIWKQNVGNYFVPLLFRAFNQVKEIRFYENEIGLVGWRQREYRLSYDFVKASIICTKISGGVAAKSSQPFTRKLLKLESSKQKFILSVSGRFPDFEKNDELLEEMSK